MENPQFSNLEISKQDLVQSVQSAKTLTNKYIIQQTSVSKASSYGMWVVFHYVLMFLSLSSGATGLSGLLHHLVDKNTAAIKTTSYSLTSYYSSYMVDWYIAISIVAFPIFLFLALSLRYKLEKHPEIREIRMRKILIFIALIWTFSSMFYRLADTVYKFVKGDALVLNIVGHLLVTLFISGIIFLYFFIELKQDKESL